MTPHPPAPRDATPDEMRAHYAQLLRHLRLVRCQYAGVLNPAGARLLVRSQLAARRALSALEEGR